MSFEPLPPAEQATHMPLEVNEIFITSNIEELTQNYDALHDLLTEQINDDIKTITRKYVTPQHSSNTTKLNDPAGINTRKSNNTTKRMTYFAKT